MQTAGNYKTQQNSLMFRWTVVTSCTPRMYFWKCWPLFIS